MSSFIPLNSMEHDYHTYHDESEDGTVAPLWSGSTDLPTVSIHEMSVDSSMRLNQSPIEKKQPFPSRPSQPQQPSLAWRRMKLALLFGATALCWGSCLLFVNLSLPHVDPCCIGIVRCSCAFFLLCIFHLFRCVPVLGACIGRSAQTCAEERASLMETISSPKAIGQMAAMGIVFSGIASILTSVSMVHISGGLASILLMVEPLVTPFLAVWLLPASLRTEVVDRWTCLGLILGVGGTALSAYPALLGGDGKGVFVGACILSSLTYAIGTVMGQYFASKRPIVHRVTGQLFFGAVFLIPTTSILRAAGAMTKWNGTESIAYIFHAPAQTWMWMLIISSVCTVGSWALFYMLLVEIGSLTTAVNFLIPPVAILLGAAGHSEWVGVNWSDKVFELSGMVVVFAGVACVLKSTYQEEVEKEKEKIAESSTAIEKSIHNKQQQPPRLSPSNTLSEADYETSG